MSKHFLFFYQSASLFTLCIIRKCDWSTYSITLAIITITLMIVSFIFV